MMRRPANPGTDGRSLAWRRNGPDHQTVTPAGFFPDDLAAWSGVHFPNTRIKVSPDCPSPRDGVRWPGHRRQPKTRRLPLLNEFVVSSAYAFKALGFH